MAAREPFQVRDATGWENAGTEHEGATEHPWLRDPVGGDLYLWKPARGRRRDRREHWAEKVAGELARHLGVPCAQVELAVQDADVGCLSRDLQGHGHELHSGAVLLGAIDPGFHPGQRHHDAYTVENISRVLADVDAPGGDPGPTVPDGFRAFDVFAGYLLFDALVLNRDRHAGNWSILRRKDGSEPDRLCPLYDNGVEAYALREDHARSFARVEGREPRLLEVARLALLSCSAAARDYWMAQITRLEPAAVGTVLTAVPEMSEPLRTFTVELVEVNRRRIAGDWSS
jgi:hypothetical protein